MEFDLYKILIIYIIFTIYQKAVAIFMSIKFPTYDDIKKATPFWQNMYKLRTLNAYISVLFIIYIYTNFKINNYIFVVLSLLLTSNVNFFLFNNQNIYYIIQKTSDNEKISNFMATRTNIYLNYIISLYIIYALIQIFLIK